MLSKTEAWVDSKANTEERKVTEAHAWWNAKETELRSWKLFSFVLLLFDGLCHAQGYSQLVLKIDETDTG